jgi:tetratricopeptide (TPR) repeat protein
VSAASSVRRWTSLPGYLVVGVVAAAVFWIAYDDGSYRLASRATIAIAVWWGVVVGLGLGLLSQPRLPRGTLIVAGSIAALAVLTLASVVWAPSAEEAFDEFNRVSLYLGVYAFVALAATRRNIAQWADALALAVLAVVAVALTSRLFPGSFDDRGLVASLPSAASRLSFPVGYWNALGVFIALGFPLLLRIALVAHRPAIRGLALAPIPAMTSALYLTSSRGGITTAFVAVLAFVLLTEDRWSAIAAITVAGLGSAVSLAALLDRDELVNGPLETAVARDQGRNAALLIGLACAGVAILYGVGARRLGSQLRPGPTTSRIAAFAAVVAVLGTIVVSNPADRFEAFKRSPEEAGAIDPGNFASAHLLSGNGRGRWQFWSAAIDQWREHLALGQGAGSYGSWWAEHASFSYFVRYAHSFYLQALGELGVLGFVLASGLVLAGIFVGVVRTLRTSGEMRVTTAALTSVFTGYAFAAAFDWMWELTAVSVVAMTVLALGTGPATIAAGRPRIARQGDGADLTSRRRWVIGVVTVVIAWALLCAQAIPLLADREVARSRNAALSGDLREAETAANAARQIQPWAATPYLQLALVSEATGNLRQANTWIDEAIERDRRNWRLWLVSARLETKLGRVSAAERSLRRAVELNPRSPLFRGLPGATS